MQACGDALGDFFSDAIRGAGNAAADGLAEDENVGLEIPFASASAGAGADGVRFVGDEKRAITTGEFARGGPVAGVGENDAHVGHGRLGEDTGYVVMLESVFQRLQIVELDYARGFGGIYWRADIAAARAYYAIVKRYERFIYRAVIAVMENENFRALRD